jgi:hypothetical protein
MDLKIIETIIAVIVYFLLLVIVNKSIDRTVRNSFMQKTRGKIIKKALNFMMLIIVITLVDSTS